MTDDPWADVPSGDYWKADEIGARIAGTIVRVGLGTDFNGNPCPQLVIETKNGESKTVTCGQANLKAQIMALTPRPKVGDKVSIAFTEKKPAAKGELHVFDVKHVVAEPVDEEVF